MNSEGLRTVLAETAADLDTTNPARVEQVRRRIRRQRLRRVGGGAAGGVVAAAAVALVLTLGSTEHAEGPVGEPKPPPADRSRTVDGEARRMTPRQVVTSENGVLRGAAVSLGDPDVRVSLWRTLCATCPKVGRSRPSFYALALTDDGYRTTRYARDPAQGEAYVIESPTDDMFLLNDAGNGREWLVGLDGSVSPVQRVDAPRQPADPRLWFLCTAPGSGPRSWCALDPATATAYQWPSGSNRGGWTESRPGIGRTAWGLDYDQTTGPVAWWQGAGGPRQIRPLVTAGQFGTVHHSQQGPLFWDYAFGADSLDLLVVTDPDSPGGVITRPAPDVPAEDEGGYLQLGQTPGGALLAWSDWPDMRIWRADDLTGADFELVFENEGVPGGLPMTVVGERIYLHTLTSDDDGRSWSATATWR